MNKEVFWKIMLETNKDSGGDPQIQQKLIEKILTDPDSLSELDNLDEEMDWEGYGYLAFTVYEMKTGKAMPIHQEISHPSEPKGEQWDEEELESLLPKLSKKHGW
jgi:hypothetical protein